MAKLYFKYGAMGSSKSAQALITKFNYEERGMSVWLLKPAVDIRFGDDLVYSRVGLSAKAESVPAYFDLVKAFLSRKPGETSVIIVDEAQFLTPGQVDQLRLIVDDYDVPVLCFGLRTDFLTHMFPGSKRLMEVAESVSEIKTICACGAKAIVNARLDARGDVVTDGEQVFLGGNESYVAMCHRCWRNMIKSRQEQG